MSRLLKAEQPHQLKAFESYFALGEGRSFPRLAAETGINPHTLKLWSRSFHWRSRIAERDTEVVRQASERTMSDAVAETERNLKMVRMAKMRLIKDIAEGKAKGAFGDLVKLIQLERELLSRPDPMTPTDDETQRSSVVIYLPDNGRDSGIAARVALPDDGRGSKALVHARPWPETS